MSKKPSSALEYDGDELRRRRKSLKLSTHELAAALGTSPAWIVRAEKGKGMLGMKPYYLVERYLQTLGMIDPAKGKKVKN